MKRKKITMTTMTNSKMMGTMGMVVIFTKTMTTMKLLNSLDNLLGNTCGPACMAWYHLINKENSFQFDIDMKYSIEDIANLCTTD